MILKKFILGNIENNNYLLIDQSQKGQNEAILIDCTEKSDEIDNALKEYEATLKYILITHGHFDHVLGVNAFKAKYNCKAFIHEDDKSLLEKMKEFARNFGFEVAEIQKADEFLKDGQIIKFGEHEIKVIHTPGHTKGGVCYLIDDMLFSGDTLFYEDVGRTDLPGGSFEEIMSSIKEKLFTLNNNIKVYPGHGPETTIGHEKINNKYL